MKKRMLQPAIIASCAVLLAFASLPSQGYGAQRSYQAEIIGEQVDGEGEVSFFAAQSLDNKGSIRGEIVTLTQPPSPSFSETFSFDGKNQFEFLNTASVSEEVDGIPVSSNVFDASVTGYVVGYNRVRRILRGDRTRPHAFIAFRMEPSGSAAELPNPSPFEGVSIKSNYRATGVNNKGEAVGQASIFDETGRPVEQRAIKWSREGEITLLPMALSVDRGYSASAEKITASGFIVGSTDVSLDGEFVLQACVWSPEGTLSRIMAASPEGYDRFVSRGADINSKGDVVGNYSVKYETSPYTFIQAFLWDAKGEVSFLGDLDREIPIGSFQSTVVNALNEKGSAVGYSSISTPNVNDPRRLPRQSELRAVLWEDGIAVELNDIVSGFDGTLIGARAINDRGQILAVGDSSEGKRVTLLLSPGK